MNIEKQAKAAIAHWEVACMGDKSKMVLAFAKKRGLEKGIITAPNGEQIAAAEYGFQLYCNALEIAGDAEVEKNESYLTVALLITMEAIREDSWAYGTKLLYEIRTEGIRLTREEVGAFLAQEGTWKTNRSKGNLMSKSMLAVSMHCSHIATLYASLQGNMLLFGKNADAKIVEQIEKLFVKKASEDGKETVPCSSVEIVESLFNHYALAYLGAECKEQVAMFLGYLRKSGFYSAPASTEYHSSFEGGLAAHELNLFIWLVNLCKPANEAEVGELVIAAFGHDLCKVGCYTEDWKNVKVYCEDGDKKEPDGRRYRWEAKQIYRYDDKMPFGHGRKSVYMLTGYFGGAIKEELAAAIDGHMNDAAENPRIAQHMMRYPLCVYLTMADVIATYIDEAE